ncbi:penicillin acylase family protein [Pseudomonas entomophila]|uniref:penicillin acylase family protein n=1 Tax=Pseudomonas entomophila TaxID=312306 RepID=UPI0015E28D8A|nr:penicillin acylase family protein [Pseudomonas entomophila]MBA1192089.1 penicillin acylase family protein [Pseudomonas entomophila]
MAVLRFPSSRPRLRAAAMLCGVLGLAGCQTVSQQSTLPPSAGVQPLKGLAQNVSVRRNPQGMPLIESSTFHDALFSLGYLHAVDRIEQMVTLRLLAQGRLAELEGPQALNTDRLMRAANLRRSADQLYADASPRLKRFFEVYARGVNAYLFRFRDALPGTLAKASYRPAYWKPEDSALLFSLYAFSQSVNLQEELAGLTLAQKVGVDRLAWLLPSAADEPLPDTEAAKLQGLDLTHGLPGLGALNAASQRLAAFDLLGSPGSASWVLGPQRSQSGRSLLASDSRAAWALSPVQIHTGKYQAAGLTLPGLPLILAGFNGKLAWSSSAVMADNQDLYLEKLRRQGNLLTYLADGTWQPARGRTETFQVRGQRPQREVMYETRHGTLLGQPGNEALGLALQLPTLQGDRSLDALFDLTRASTLERASDSARAIGAAALNLVFADAQHIGWQVTGRYPNRRDGQGLLPSPGWDGRYDWDGYADPMLHPYDQDPARGWIGHANQRSLARGYGMQLSNTWDYPERAERLAQLIGTGRHDVRSLAAMQNDQLTPLAGKLKQMLDAPGMASALPRAIDALPAAQRDLARQALARLKAFDGRLSAQSADAALYALFLHQVARQTFLDELGPESSEAWQTFVANARLSYSAQADHLLGRDDSPFWDDRSTPQHEDKPTLLARSLAAAMEAGRAQLGNDPRTWQWGRLHAYRWPMSTWQGLGDGVARPSRAAGGDFSTLALTPYAWGRDFDTQLPPSARLIVDFGQAEPLRVLTSTAPSGHPASAHANDNLQDWFAGRFTTLPLQPQHFTQGYGTQRLSLVPER